MRAKIEAGMNAAEIIGATLSAQMTISTVLAAEGRVTAALTQGPMLVTDCPNYEGSYEIRPAVYPQELETAEKRMKKNLLVQEIPYMEVTNASGGTTVIIG